MRTPTRRSMVFRGPAPANAVRPARVSPAARRGPGVAALLLAFLLAPVCALPGCDASPASGTSSKDGAAAEGATDSGVPSAAGTVYGPGVTDGATLSVQDLLARADTLNGQRVRVRGMVTDVCAKRGCWIRIGEESDPRTVTFKVTDGVIVFPMSARGKGVVAEGTCEKRVLSLERTREIRAHEAEESGEPFDPASVKEPATVVLLHGIGAVVGGK